MDFFTGDWHLGHENIIKYCERPFAGADEMNSILINNINEVAGPEDRVFNVGDVAFKCSDDVLRALRNRIVCHNIYVLPGNHDKEQTLKKFFTVLPIGYMYEHIGYRLYLSHYAHRVWPHAHHGAGHLYGHSHGKLSQMVTLEGKGAMSFDVGVDCWEYKPLSLNQVKSEMTRLVSTNFPAKSRPVIDDHHRARS